LPRVLETPPLLVEALEAELAAGGGRQRSRALSELFELFTRQRSGLASMRYLDIPRLRDAYLRYHLPLNCVRALYVIEEVRALQPQANELEEVVDLGAGPGSAALASLFFLRAGRPRVYTLLDRSRAAVGWGRRLLERCAAALAAAPAGAAPCLARVETRVARLPSLPPLPRRALVWLSMVLNELGGGSRRDARPEAILLDRLAAALDPPSLLLVVEPALRLPGRNLLRFHDAALASGSWRVLAPCTHQRRCPLLRAAGNSWCHFRFHWDAPEIVRQIAEPLGLEWRTPHLAYLVLERGAARAERPAACGRVIGDPMPLERGGRGIYVCAQGERRLLPLREQEIERGDLVAG
jgi:ribosomal protein RSM22 (predicted rRNA methylase)